MYQWDDRKSLLNIRKHGISFDEARDHIFEGPNLLATGVAYEKDEVRHAVIGKFNGRYYTGIFTIRSGVIRIISVRRSRREEESEAKRQGI